VPVAQGPAPGTALARAVATAHGRVPSRPQSHAETGVAVCVTTTDGQAVLAVTDDGPGIEPADRKRVFKRFVRLEDGRRSPRGARFVLRLPLMEENRRCRAGED
jgi:signal transduction histidine kinase